MASFSCRPGAPRSCLDSLITVGRSGRRQMPCCCGASTSNGCIPQANTSFKLDFNSGRQLLQNRVSYRNFGTHESIVANLSVEASAGMAGIRWFELRDPNGTPFLHQQGTYAPGTSDGIHRWMGALAMDSGGDIALGYSASNATMFPGIRYSGRLVTDPPGTLPQGEGTIIAGTGSQGSSSWGDYSTMVVDPTDDCTFWYANEYVPVSSSLGWRTRIASFKFASCTPVALRVFDVSGRRVRHIVDGQYGGGSYRATWDAKSEAGAAVGAGMYFARLIAGADADAATILLLR